jgi:hypothetical protein
LDQDQLEATLRLTTFITPTLTIQGYVQWMHEVERRSRWRALGADGQMADVEPGAVGRSLASLNAQIILRWEYRAGSVIYLVYQHGSLIDQESEGRFRPWRALDEAARVAADDKVLLKVSYLFGL